jgi:hypothetical protein
MSFADWTLEPLEFEPATPGQCCALCNPHALADYEVSCVAVRRQGGNRFYVCTSCVRLLGRTLRERATQTNAADRRRWAKLCERVSLPKRCAWDCGCATCLGANAGNPREPRASKPPTS